MLASRGQTLVQARVSRERLHLEALADEGGQRQEFPLLGRQAIQARRDQGLRCGGLLPSLQASADLLHREQGQTLAALPDPLQHLVLTARHHGARQFRDFGAGQGFQWAFVEAAGRVPSGAAVQQGPQGSGFFAAVRPDP